MKQFLRYQTSGTIYLLWLGIFYFTAVIPTPLSKLIELVNKDFFLAVLSAFPIGVVLHQLSVNVKNCIVSKFYVGFDDFPDKVIPLCKIEQGFDCDKQSDKKIAYYLDKISNLNSFYYARIDNGVFAPLFAFITAALVSPDFCAYANSARNPSIIAIILAVALTIYLPRLNNEILYYKVRIESLESKISEREELYE